MATLKISATSVRWITGVKMIIDLGNFRVSPVKGRSWSDDRGAVRAAAESAGLLEGHSFVRPVEFFGSEDVDEVNGLALLVEREAQYNTPPEVWLIPRRSAFLLGDSGATIDRI